MPLASPSTIRDERKAKVRSLLEQLGAEFDLVHSEFESLRSAHEGSSREESNPEQSICGKESVTNENRAMLVDAMKDMPSQERHPQVLDIDDPTSILTRKPATGGAILDPKAVKEGVEKAMCNMSELHKIVRDAANKFTSENTSRLSDGGVWVRLVTNQCFDNIILVLICWNGLWIAIDTDLNKEDYLLDADPIFQFMEIFFCIIFTIECLIRSLAFRSVRLALTDAWFVLDVMLVVLMIFETVVVTLVIAIQGRNHGSIGLNSSLFRLLRLARLTRLSRLVRFVPDLAILIKGVLQASRSVLCTMGLLAGILYVFAIALRQYSVGTDMGRQYFSSVPHAMFTLFFQATLLDGIADLMTDVTSDSVLCAILLFVIILLAALTLMNMLVGVICEVMTGVSSRETEDIAMKLVRERVGACLHETASLEDGYISKADFEQIITNPGAAKALAYAGVDVLALIDFADFFFQSDQQGEQFDVKFDFDEFMSVVMQVRGINPATVRDIVDLRKWIHTENTGRNKALLRLHENQTKLATNQHAIEAQWKEVMTVLQQRRPEVQFLNTTSDAVFL